MIRDYSLSTYAKFSEKLTVEVLGEHFGSSSKLSFFDAFVKVLLRTW